MEGSFGCLECGVDSAVSVPSCYSLSTSFFQSSSYHLGIGVKQRAQGRGKKANGTFPVFPWKSTAMGKREVNMRFTCFTRTQETGQDWSQLEYKRIVRQISPNIVINHTETLRL